MRGQSRVGTGVRRLARSGAALGATALGGCRHSPSFNVLGSYFPGWIACLVGSVLTTAVLRWGINRVGLERRLPLLPLFYFSLALLIACIFWLIGFE